MKKEEIKLVEPMSFSEALTLLKAGEKLTRIGWGGKHKFLWHKPATILKAEYCRDEVLKSLCEKKETDLVGFDTICLHTPAGSFITDTIVLTGWVPSQIDMFTDDWAVVE